MVLQFKNMEKSSVDNSIMEAHSNLQRETIEINGLYFKQGGRKVREISFAKINSGGIKAEG